jgi:lysozyme
MKTSPAGIKTIIEFEACRLEAYRDAATPPVWTVGVGHTGPGVTQGLRITQQRAEDLLAADLLTFELAVSRAVTVPLAQCQYDALISFTFNVGVGSLLSSTLLKNLNAGDYRLAADQFLKWIHAGAEVLPGLMRRRAAERTLFLSGITDQTDQQAPAA